MAKEPLDQNALTQEQKDFLIAEINKKAPNFKCSVCGHRNFSLIDHLISGIPVSPAGVMHVGGTNYPMAMVVCTNCYHCVTFAAIPFGLGKGDT